MSLEVAKLSPFFSLGGSLVVSLSFKLGTSIKIMSNIFEIKNGWELFFSNVTHLRETSLRSQSLHVEFNIPLRRVQPVLQIGEK